MIDADVKPVLTFICDCCKLDISPSTFYEHLKLMAMERWHHKMGSLTWDGWFRQFEIDFLKSKVVLSNGLVLYKQNLKCTDMGDHADFKNRAKEIFSSLKHRQ